MFRVHNLSGHLAVLCALLVVFGIELHGVIKDKEEKALEQLSQTETQTDGQPVEEAVIDPELLIATNNVQISDLAAEKAIVKQIAQSIQEIDEELHALFQAGEFGLVREHLLEMAADAVSKKDNAELGQTLMMLGQVSIEEQDLDSAEVFLSEALDVLEESESEVDEAQVLMQMGRLHIKSREIARTAALAFDSMQIGRWQLQKRQFAQSEANLKLAVETNLSINRFGSAASAYQSLAELYKQLGNQYEAEQSALESARLYASSGRMAMARQVLGELVISGVEEWRTTHVKEEIDINYTNYQHDIEQIGRARDYQRLYNHYKNAGDKARAWEFRVLAANSLARVSKRAMFHRQQGVLAILYNSNDSMELAETYLTRAKTTFDQWGMNDLADQTGELNSAIF